MHRPRHHRFAVSVMGLGLIAGLLVSPVLAADTRRVTIGSAADGSLPVVTVSAGESISFPLTVANTGPQTINNVLLKVGRDDDPAVEKNGAATKVPTAPVALPAGVTVAASGAGASVCDSGALMTCAIGTLRSKAAYVITVTINASRAASAATVDLKAVVTVAEIGNDNGANTDTFAAEGSLILEPFSCNAVTAQRTGNESKVVATCGVTDPEAGAQSASVVLPSSLTSVALKDNLLTACPTTTCIGGQVQADITGDSTSDVVAWTIEVDLTALGLGTPNLTKLVVQHFDDQDGETLIPLTRKNACKSATSTDCGAASTYTATNGHTILMVVVQTAGNGKTRIL